jgi:hypothetical protein
MKASVDTSHISDALRAFAAKLKRCAEKLLSVIADGFRDLAASIERFCRLIDGDLPVHRDQRDKIQDSVLLLVVLGTWLAWLLSA